MAYLVIEINAGNRSIQDLNELMKGATKPQASVNNVKNLIDACQLGTVLATVQVTSRDTTASVTTSGTGSQQQLYTLN